MGEERRQFEDIFMPYLDAAYNLARWIVQHDQDAKDIVQEAYLRAFKGYHGFRGGNSRAWLLTIVRNTAYTWISRHAADGKLVLLPKTLTVSERLSKDTIASRSLTKSMQHCAKIVRVEPVFFMEMRQPIYG